VVKIVLCILVFGLDASLLVRWLKKLEYRRLVVIGEVGDSVEDHVVPLIWFLAFVGTLWVLGG
jgi:hypothetical protein